MLRSRPTTLSITDSELKAFELRSRYRRYLRSISQAKSNHMGLFGLRQGLIDDDIPVTRASYAESYSPVEESDLEADTGFIYLGSGATMLSGTEVEQSTERLVDAGAPVESERERLLNRTAQDSGLEQYPRYQRPRLNAIYDPPVTLSPPVSSRHRPLTAISPPFINRGTGITAVDGSSGISIGLGVEADHDVEELTEQLDERLILHLNTMQVSPHRPQYQQLQHVSDRHSPLHNSRYFGDSEEIIIFDDELSSDQEPQTPTRLREAHLSTHFYAS